MLAACSSEGSAVGDDADGGSDGGGAVSSALQACTSYFDALGKIAPRCINDVSLDPDFEPARRTGFLKECQYKLTLPGVPKTFAAKVAACAKTLDTIACETVLSEEDPCGLSDERGTRESGASCEESLQCASDSCTAGGDECGVCGTVVADGAACDGQATVCDDASSCVELDSSSTSVDGTCQPKRKAGAACTFSSSCEGALVCDNDICKVAPKLGEACESDCAGTAVCNMSVCVAVGKLGEACVGESQFCEAGLSCNETSTKCEKRRAPTVAVGDTCNGPDLECKEGYCEGSSEDSVCIAYAKVGEACGEDKGKVLCENGLRCTAGKCVELTPLCTN